ncbi:PIG-L deacetylase family protein [Acidobacteriota bacterium]
MKQNRILVVAAHPDDEVLGCGGTIRRLVQEGNTAYTLILGEGVTSRFEKREMADVQDVKKLKNAAEAAAKVLGIQELFLFDFPDNRFDSVPLLEIIKVVEKTIQNVDPHVIYTHHSNDLNIDHQITHKAVLTASRPVEGQKISEILSFQIPSSTEWAFNKDEKCFQANVFVDIESTLAEKIEALNCYSSEMREFPHPRSIDGVKSLAKSWGSVAGFKAAEAFELIRKIY